MNIISIVNGKISDIKINSKLKVDEKNICIDAISDTNLYLQVVGNEDFKIKIKLEENTSFRIFNYNDIKDCNIDFDIDQNKNSNLTMNCFSKNDDILIHTIVNLNGENSKLEYNYSCIGKTTKDLRINHNYSNTNSLVKTHAVSKSKKIKFMITEFVPKGSINCNLSQSSKIVNLENQKCLIKPILLIDEKEVNASHSSIITPINNDDLLYLRSRGISEQDAIRLLVNGFLISNLSLREEEKHILFEKHVFRR